MDTFNEKLKNLHQKGKKWIGVDGLMCIETSALLTILLMIFFNPYWSMAFSAIVGIAKSTLDKSHGHENETHDLICCIFGIVLGAIIGTTQAAITLFA